jgi:hypothetical protein
LVTTVGTSALSAASGSTMPKPKVASRPSLPTSTAVLINRLTTFAADICGHLARTSAAAAETRGAAKLVPATLA